MRLAVVMTESAVLLDVLLKNSRTLRSLIQFVLSFLIRVFFFYSSGAHCNNVNTHLEFLTASYRSALHAYASLTTFRVSRPAAPCPFSLQLKSWRLTLGNAVVFLNRSRGLTACWAMRFTESFRIV